MSLNILRLHAICRNPDLMVSRLQLWGLIPREQVYRCPKCDGFLKLISDHTRPVGFRWNCSNVTKNYSNSKTKKCGHQVEFRTGTFFAHSKLSIFQILAFVNLWVENAPLKLIAQQLDMDVHTCVHFSSFNREVVFDAFVVNNEKLGGPVDESKFGKVKPVKGHRGHRVDGQWVFGGYERGTGRVFMVAVEDRGADTLLPIIKHWIEKGTTIISDFWRTYDCLDRNGYKHLKVNHSLHFKDPETGAHTNSIESSWRAAKAITTSAGNLARYMFYKRCAEVNKDRTEEFFRLAGLLYNPAENLPPRNVDDDEEDGEVEEDEGDEIEEDEGDEIE